MTPFENIIDFTTIEHAYKQTQLGSRKFRQSSILFDLHKVYNLTTLWRQLKNETYEVGQYIKFSVYEPKERIIHAPLIRDKIVQFLVHEQLQEIYKNVFINDSYACIVGQGTHKAVKAVYRYMRTMNYQTNGEAWIVKLDVRKYFYSIDRDILKRILRKKIHDKRFLQLLDKIIDSSPEGSRGIPLGNISSQDFANIYLNELDQYAKHYLGLRYYVRYMDDVVAVVPSREQAKETLAALTKFLNERLNLETNQKSQVFPIKQGVNAYGFKIKTTHIQLRDSSKKAMKRRIKRMDEKLQAGEITEHEINQAVDSWLGHARHSNSYNLAKSIFKNYNYIKIEGGTFYGNVLRNGKIGRPVQGQCSTAKTNEAVEN